MHRILMAILGASLSLPFYIEVSIGAVQTCPCREPIRADGTADGTCTITQQGAAHCNIRFTTRETAINVAKDSAFRAALISLGIPVDRVIEDITQIEMLHDATMPPTERIIGLSSALQAVIAVGSWDAQKKTFDKIAELILRLLDPGGISETISGTASVTERKGIVSALSSFAGRDLPGVSFEKVFNTRIGPAELTTTRGCFMIRDKEFFLSAKASWASQGCP